MCKQHYHIMTIAIPTPNEQEKFNTPAFVDIYNIISKYNLLAMEIEAKANGYEDMVNKIFEFMYEGLYQNGKEYITHVQE